MNLRKLFYSVLVIFLVTIINSTALFAQDLTAETQATGSIPEPYFSKIKQAKQALEEDWSFDKCRANDLLFNTDSFYYSDSDQCFALDDLNGDGIQELIFFINSNSRPDKLVNCVYTVTNNNLQLVTKERFGDESLTILTILQDGSIFLNSDAEFYDENLRQMYRGGSAEAFGIVGDHLVFKWGVINEGYGSNYYYTENINDMWSQKISVDAFKNYRDSQIFRNLGSNRITDEWSLETENNPSKEVVNGKFIFEDSADKPKEGDQKAEHTYDFEYRDDYFWGNNYEFNNKLALMSIKTAMAAFDRNNIIDLFNKIGCTNYIENNPEDENVLVSSTYSTDTIYYPKHFGDNRSLMNSIGYAISGKDLDEETSLIVVAVRGGKYDLEWGGNFDIGSSGDHNSFNLASRQVLNGIKKYLIQYPSKRFVKVWITGFSRGAAVANLVAAQLDDDAISGIGKGNVYAYTFETPQNTVADNAGHVKYSNIFNIINPADLVPKVAFSEWNFKRYGKDFYLPAEGLTQKNYDYDKLEENMLSHYDNIPSTNKSNRYKPISAQAPGFDNVSGLLVYMIGNRIHYVDHAQELFKLVFANKMGGMNFSIPGDLYADCIKHVFNNTKKNVVHDIINIILKNESDKKNTKEAVNKLFENYENPDETVESLENLSQLMDSIQTLHYPELSIAWLESFEEAGIDLSKANFIPYGYRKGLFNCPINITVTEKATGQVVAQITNDQVQKISNGLYAEIDENGQKVVYFPGDSEYDVQITPTDNGKMTYTLIDYKTQQGTPGSVATYSDIEIKPGDSINASIPSQNDTVTDSELIKNNKIVDLNVKQTGNDVKMYSVNVTGSETEGSFFGDGSFYYGEYAQLEAQANSGYKFAGWYDGSTLLSTENPYRLEINKDYTITAKFEKIPSTDNSDKPEASESISVYRLYNEESGEHLYTSDQNEYNVLPSFGWTKEGTGWNAPKSGTAVYRLYNPSLADHLYTTDKNEVRVLTTERGWQADNGGRPLFYSGGSVPVYRLYHEGIRRHLLTRDENENTVLGGRGWTREGVGLRALS